MIGKTGKHDEPSLRAGIIVNPKHRRTGRAYARLVRELKSSHIKYRSEWTTQSRDGAWQALELVDWGADVIVLLSGDGTVRTSAPVLADAGVPVLLIPAGTANVLSRHVGISSSRDAISRAARTLVGWASRDSETVSVPINSITYRRPGTTWLSDHFLCMAGVGGDARTVSSHEQAPGLLGYILGGSKALFAPGFDARLGADETSVTAQTWSIMASKVASPAGPIPVFPQARIEAREFVVLQVGPLSPSPSTRLGEWIGIASACLRIRPENNAHLAYFSSTDLCVKLDTLAPVQVDGDVIGPCQELRISGGTKGLQVLVPRR